MGNPIVLQERLIEIRWHGRGGQGVVTAGKLLADAALDTGMYFQTFPDYGPERMGAPIRAFTRLSSEPINIHSQINQPNVVIVMDATVMTAVDVTEGLSEDGALIFNTEESPEKIRKKLKLNTGRVFTVDADSIALKHMGRKITNTPMLGALASALGVFKIEELEDQIRNRFAEKFGKKIVDANIAALREAAEEIKEG